MAEETAEVSHRALAIPRLHSAQADAPRILPTSSSEERPCRCCEVEGGTLLERQGAQGRQVELAEQFRFRGRPLGRPQIDDVRQFGAADRPPAGDFVAAAVAGDGEQPRREFRPLWVERCQGSERARNTSWADSSWSVSGGVRLRISVNSGRWYAAPRGGGTTRRLPPAPAGSHRGRRSWRPALPSAPNSR